MLTYFSKTPEQEVPQTSIRKEFLCSEQKDRNDELIDAFCKGIEKCACRPYLRSIVLYVATFTSQKGKSVLRFHITSIAYGPG